MKISKTLLLALVLLFISLIVRLYSLDTLPRNLNPDEADTLMTYIIEAYDEQAPLIGLNWNGAPLINATLQGLFWELSGESITGLRLPSVLFSTASILLFFMIGNHMTQNKLMSFCLAIALSTNAWFLNFSRSSWENIYTSVPVLLGVFGCYFVFEKKQWINGLIILSAASVLGFYSYHPGKLIPIAAGLGALGIFFHRTKEIKQKILGLIISLVIILILTAPQLAVTLQQAQNASNRIQAVSIFHQNQEIHLPQHILTNLYGFSLFQIESFHYGNWSRYIPPERPLIPPFIVLFYLGGIVIMISKRRYLVFYYLLLLLPVQLLSFPTPDAARAVHIVPLIYLFSLIGMNELSVLFHNKLEKHHHVLLHILSGIACTIVLLSSSYELSTYFRWVQSSDLINVRKPAIDINEYESWINDVKESAKTGRRFTIDEWQEWQD